MKSYTDIEQSKKLAEILSLESADMVLLHEEPYETSDSKFDGLHQALCVPFNKYDKSWRQKYKNISYFPCWSLAALLENIPVYLTKEDKTLRLQIDMGLDDFDIWYEESGLVVSELDCISEDFVNACVEMIIKLHERNLL